MLLISEQFLRVYSDAIGKLTYISIQNKELPEPFVVGDFVDFVNMWVILKICRMNSFKDPNI